MNFRIWNKIDKINNVDATKIINGQNIGEDDVIFLVYGEEDVEQKVVTRIENLDIIKSNYKLDKDLSVEDSISKYFEIEKQQQLDAEKYTKEEQEMKVTVKTLEVDVNNLSEEVTTNSIFTLDLFEMIMVGMSINARAVYPQSVIITYCNAIERGLRTFASVPDFVKGQVAEELINRGYIDSDLEEYLKSLEVEETYPTFKGTNAKTINFGATFDTLNAVSATDEIDGDLTDKIILDGEVDINNAGIYTLTYEVMNLRGFKTTKTRKITVKESVIEDNIE